MDSTNRMKSENRLFSMEGKRLSQRTEGVRTLPEVLQLKSDGAGYVATEDLADAVDAALLTGLPLLLTGEPGTGKTQLATAIAYQLELPLLRYDTKSTATARELLYSFDVVGRFYDAQIQGLTVKPRDPVEKLRDPVEKLRDPSKPEDYVIFGPLGAAIYLASDNRAKLKHYPKALENYLVATSNTLQKRCVVLIDEVDKAPRDFPNDLLNELDKMSFLVAETGDVITAKPQQRPIVILTSNAERELPEPFLRRCAYFHIVGFVKGQERRNKVRLQNIIQQRLDVDPKLTNAALDHYITLRTQDGWEKAPSIAELLVWLQLVAERKLQPSDFSPVSTQVFQTYYVLFKTKDDLARARGEML